jgi:hypothetical protein
MSIASTRAPLARRAVVSARAPRLAVALWALTAPLAGAAVAAPSGAPWLGLVATSTGAGATDAPVPAPTPAPAPFDHRAALADVEGRAAALQARVDAAQGKVARLRDDVVKASKAPTRALVIHREEVNPSFRLDSIAYELDGVVVLSRGPERLRTDPVREVEVLAGEITPGSHRLRVAMIYVGTGEGTYARAKEFRFAVEKAHEFTAIEGRIAKVTFTTVTRPEPRLELRDRLAVRVTAEVLPITAARPKSDTPAASPAPASAP